MGLYPQAASQYYICCRCSWCRENLWHFKETGKGKEEVYFLEHDEYSILKRKFREYENKYGTTFGVHIPYCSGGKIIIRDDNENERDITINELKALLSKYEELDRLVEKITEEAFEMGADYYIMKPFDQENIIKQKLYYIRKMQINYHF